MAAIIRFLSRIRLVYRRSSPLLKCVVLGSVVLCTAALITLFSVICGHQNQAGALKNQIQQLEKENAVLTQYIDELGTTESIKRIAREELGLVDDSITFFTPAE